MDRNAGSGERAVVMRTLLLDTVAARATGLLEAQGVAAILLKGAVTASWLYKDDVRRYRDVDLLVDPAQRDHAVEILETIGYTHWMAGADKVEYGSNEIELIGPNRTCIDLHHTLLGVAATPARCWEVLSKRTERMCVGGRVVAVLDRPARTMHLALHVAQGGPADTRAVADLERGLDQLPGHVWKEAASLARSIDAIDAYAAGLRVVEHGRHLATELGLVPPRDVALILRTQSAPPEALQIQNLLETDSLRGRLQLIGRKLWPTTTYMIRRVPGARAGGTSLLIARLRRTAALPSKLRVALWNWNRARRTARRRVTEATGSRRQPGPS